MKKLLYLLPFFLLSCGNENQTEKPQEEKQETVATPQQEKKTALTREQLEKVDYLYSTFKDVDTISKETWISDFQQEIDLEGEMNIWMMMANAYNGFAMMRDLTIEQKRDVYRVVLARSATPEDVVLQRLKLKSLSEEDMKEIMKNYTLDNQPIFKNTLSDEQLEKVDYIHEILKGVDPVSKTVRIEDFMKENDPDSEIAVWIKMADAYKSYTKDKNLTIDQKTDVFKVVLVRSSFSEEEVLAKLQLKHLSKEDIKAVMDAYVE